VYQEGTRRTAVFNYDWVNLRRRTAQRRTTYLRPAELLIEIAQQ